MLTLIGTVIFVFSAALPMISIQLIVTFSIRLFDMYRWLGLGPSVPENDSQWTEAFSTVRAGLFLVAILYFITVVAGFISAVTSPKVSLIAGVLGMACWLSSMFAILQLKSVISQLGGPFGAFANLVQIGYGVYVGILGSGILLVSYFVATREAKAAAAPSDFAKSDCAH